MNEVRPVPKPSFPRRSKKRVNKGKFDKATREAIHERDGKCCVQCGAMASQIHHVKFKSQMGEGIYTNGMTVCNDCHMKIHQNKRMQRKWQEWFHEIYGADYWHA